MSRETFVISIDLSRNGATIPQTKLLLREFFDLSEDPTLYINGNEISIKLHKITINRINARKGRLV